MSNGSNNSHDVWTQRIEAVGKSLVTPVLTALTTVLANYLTISITLQNQITKARDEVKVVASAAATNAKTAAVSAKSAANELDVLRLNQDQIAILAQANLKQWKAYNTKTPEAVEEAKEAATMAETLDLPRVAAPP